MEWRSIATAPKDSTVLIYDAYDRRVGQAYHTVWNGSDAWCWEEMADGLVRNPTHWMPLPTPPDTEEKP
jgi:hypothetical protein